MLEVITRWLTATFMVATLGVVGSVGTVSAAELYGTLKKIKEKGTITVGHREGSVPFAYIGPDGEPIGYTMDLCMRIVEEVKKELNLPDLEIELAPVTPQTRIPLIANKTIDMECGSTTNNLTRDKQVDYLHVTFITGTQIAVKKDSGIKGIDDLDDKSIALALGTTNEKAVKRAAKERNLNIDYLMVKDHPEGWLALETDRVDAYSTDHILLWGLISKSRNPDQFDVVGEFLSYDPYAIMVQQDDSAFRDLGNRVLSDLMRSGEIAKIYKKWFTEKIPGQKNPVGVPLGEILETAFEIQALPY